MGEIYIDNEGSFSGNIGPFPILALRGKNSIIGRGLILHELPDQCIGETGNAGGRIAQGVIGATSRSDMQFEKFLKNRKTRN